MLINYKKENMSYDLDAVSDIFFFDKQPNILEKAKKPHVYRGYTGQPKTRLKKKTKKGKSLTHPQVVPSHSKKPKRE